MPGVRCCYFVVRLALVVVGVSCIPFHTFAADPSTKAAVPKDAAIATVSKTVGDIYKNDLEAAKSLDAKAKLAVKLLQVGIDTRDDATARFVLYRAARKLAIDAGDAELTLRIVDQSAADFMVDAVAMQRAVLVELAPSVRTPDDLYIGVRLARRLARTAAAADQYETALPLAKLALEMATKMRDAGIFKQCDAEAKQLEQDAEQYQAVRPLLAKLESTPNDPAANAAVGKYQCWVHGHFAKGMPMLALGDDGALKELAGRDLIGANDAPGQIALGDAWYDAAQKQPAALRAKMLARAAYWYRQSPLGASGVDKLLIDKRLAESDAANSPIRVGEWVELLDYVELASRDHRGPWVWQAATLAVPKHEGAAYVVLPVAIQGNFEVRLRATRDATDQLLTFSLPFPGHEAVAAFNIGGQNFCGIWGLNRLGGIDPANPSRHAGVATTPNQPFTVEWKVERKNNTVALNAIVNGQRAIAWQGDLNSLSSVETHWNSERCGERLLLGTYAVPLRIHGVRFRLTSGTARLVE